MGDEIENFAAKVTVDCVSQGVCDDHVARSSAKVAGVTITTANAEQNDLMQYVAKLMQVRGEHSALYNGERRNLWLDDTLYADLKVDGEQQVIYVLNTGESQRTLNVDLSRIKTATEFVDLMTGESINIQSVNGAIQVPRLTGRLLLVK